MWCKNKHKVKKPTNTKQRPTGYHMPLKKQQHVQKHACAKTKKLPEFPPKKQTTFRAFKNIVSLEFLFCKHRNFQKGPRWNPHWNTLLIVRIIFTCFKWIMRSKKTSSTNRSFLGLRFSFHQNNQGFHRCPRQEHIDGMKAGSVVVDLAAETGGNVETTKRLGCGRSPWFFVGSQGLFISTVSIWIFKT